MTAVGTALRHGPLDAAPSSPVLDARRELMIAHLADWREVLDPCAGGHTEHGPEAHRGRRIVHSISAHGLGADWDYDAVIEYIRTARQIGVSIEATRQRDTHVPVLGADDRLMFFEVRP